LKALIFAGLLTASLVSATVHAANDELPHVASGAIERLPNFPSRYVDPRNVDVWLPEGYSSAKRYNVLYMHDGQMLFDAARTWNKQAWRVDQSIPRLLVQGKMPDTIVVGIWNNGKYRHAEYFPEKSLANLAEPARGAFIESNLAGRPLADRYLRFIVEELKPAIDKKYATQPERDHTFIMGSSMGGIVSLYAMSEYPDVFGAAACLSTHWIGTHQANGYLPMAMFQYMQAKLPSPAQHRLYMDRGTETLDALYRAPQDFADQLVADKGYTGANFLSRVIAGAANPEIDWSVRLDEVLTFLFADARKPASAVRQ
jgi:enterochelin esterase-like enzyme